MADSKLFDLKKLAEALDPSRDGLSKYLGVITNKNRYALRKQNGDPIETPQLMKRTPPLQHSTSTDT